MLNGPRLERPTPSHRGDLSQEMQGSSLHPKPVLTKSFDDSAAKRTRNMYQALSASSVGLELGISVVLGVLGGMWLDSEVGSSPWFMLFGMAIGLIAGFRSVMRAVERSDRVARQEEARG
jgi:ATP synthase protein I